MTMEVKDKFTITTKRKEHPSAKKYPGRQSMEFGNGVMNFLSELSDKEIKELEESKLVVEPEASDEFFDSIQAGDIVGLGLFTGLDDVPCAYQWEITEINHSDGVAKARDVTFESPKRPSYKGRETSLYYEDFSVGLGMGFGEILMRDNKPFGVPEEIEQTVAIYGPAGEADEAGNAQGVSPVDGLDGPSEPATSNVEKEKLSK